jgi:LCP family protein required for cell wall assembly
MEDERSAPSALEPDGEPDPAPELKPRPPAPEGHKTAAPQRPGWRRPGWSRRRKIVTWTCGILALLLVVGGTAVGVIWYHLDHNIRTVDSVVTPSDLAGAQNILLVGSDNRSGSDARYGTAQGARSDTAILFHTPADRREAVAVSIPRDSMVRIPACARSDGSIAPAGFDMFNSAYDTGGIACTVKTEEALTGIPVTHFVVLDFTGFVTLVDALGGVKVCVTAAVTDADSKLNIPAGTSTLDGEQALAFVRVRHVGDGSDLARIRRQQYFLNRMATQVRQSDLFSRPLRLYQVLDAATKAIITDTGLGSLDGLKALADSLSRIPDGRTLYVTVPNEPYPSDPNRVQWTEPDATNLWNSLKREPSSASASTVSSLSADSTGFDTCPVN